MSTPADTLTINDPEARGDMPPAPNLGRMADAFKTAMKSIDAAPDDKIKVLPDPTTVAPQKPVAEPKPTAEPAKPKAEATKEDQDELPEGIKDKSPAAKEAFKLVREQRNEAKKRIAELEKEMADRAQLWAKPNPKVEEELNTLRQQSAEMGKKLKVLEVTNAPELHQFFKKKFADADKVVARVVGSELAEQTAKLLKMEDSDSRTERLQEIADQLPGVKQSQLGALITQYDAIHAEREQAIKDAETNADLIWQKREQEATEAKTRTAQSMESILTQLSGPQGAAIFQKREGNDEWNRTLDQNFADARKLASGEMSEEDRLFAFAVASRMPAYHSALMEQGALITKLQEQIKQLQGSTPTVGRQAASSSQPTSSGAGNKFLDRVRAEMGE